MKKLNRITIIGLVALMGASSFAAPKGKSVLSLKETITDNNIVFPSSYAADTHEMMNNWYLQNYAILDYTVDQKSPGNVSDQEYMRRLKQLPTTIEMPYNPVVRAYIDRYTQRSRTLVEQMLGMSLYYFPIFEEALEKEGLPLELKYIPVIESAMNPNAVSPAGAGGLWQFMVGTAKGMGLEVSTLVDERRDPYRSSEKAVQYFKQLYEIYGDWSLAIAAYNCGPGNVNKAIMRAGSDNVDFWAIYNYLPKETRGYVPAFIAANYVMTYYKEHNISPALAKKPLIIDTVKVTRRVNFNQISQVLNIPIDEIRILNPQYRHDIIPGDIHPYTLALPSQQIYSYVMVEDSIYNYRRDVYGQRTYVNPGDGNYQLDDKPYDENNVSGGGMMGSTPGTIDYSDKPTTSVGTPNTNSNYASNYASSANDNYGAEGYHKVQQGESLAGIAFKYGMTPDELIGLNDLSDNKVSSGQLLKIIDKRGSGNDPADDMANVTSIRPDDYNSELQAPPRPVNQHNDRQQQAAPPAPKKQQQQAQQPVPAKKQQQAAPKKQQQPTYSQQQHGKGKGKQQAAQQQAQQSTKSGKKGKKGQQQQAAQQQNQKIEVKKGENLTTISKRTGIPVDQLRQANGGSDKVQAGSTLNVNKGGKGGKSQQAAGQKSGKNSSKATNTKSGSKSTGKSTGKGSGKSGGKKKK